MSFEPGSPSQNTTQGTGKGGGGTKPKKPKKPSYSPAPSYSPPSYSGGYGGSTGGSGGTYQQMSDKPKQPKKGPPTLAQWLGKDATYQDQLRAFQRSLNDFNVDWTKRKDKVGADYTTGVTQMKDQKVKDLNDIMSDFAARGLLTSGLFAQRNADYEKTFNTNLTNLDTNKKSLLEDLSTEGSQFRRDQELAKENAKKEAAKRRADKYGI